jgi:hypothetical protein
MGKERIDDDRGRRPKRRFRIRLGPEALDRDLRAYEIERKKFHFERKAAAERRAEEDAANLLNDPDAWVVMGGESDMAGGDEEEDDDDEDDELRYDRRGTDGDSKEDEEEDAKDTKDENEENKEHGEGVYEEWMARWNESPFDGFESASFEANVEYMQTRFGLFVPHQSLLPDPRGLFSHLQEKICRYHCCLYCSRPFKGIAACRRHMIDKSHCKVDFEALLSSFRGGDGECSVDGVNFGGVGGSGYVSMGKNKTKESVHLAGKKTVKKTVGEDLVLSNGSRVGHRRHQRYYKQTKHQNLLSLRGRPKSVHEIRVRLSLREGAKRRHQGT